MVAEVLGAASGSAQPRSRRPWRLAWLNVALFVAASPFRAAAGDVPAGASMEARLAGAVMANLARSGDMSTALAAAFVSAPNGETSIDPSEDASGVALAEHGVSRQMRVEVGPPEASILLWIIYPEGERTEARGTILFLHGICSTRWEHMGKARHAARLGFTCVLPDFRGHGRSSGRWLTYGWREARDMQQVLDALLAEDTITEPVGVFGLSYGAATGNLLAAIDSRVKAVVSVACYTSMREVVPLYARGYLPLLGGALSDEALQKAIAAGGRLAAFDPDDAAPVAAVSCHRAPTLIIHGAADENIPASHAQRLYDMALGPKRLVILDEAGHHCGGSPTVLAESMTWFAAYMQETEGR